MGTCNFINQRFIDLYTAPCDDDFDYIVIEEDFKHFLKAAFEKFKKELFFFKPVIKSGYYSGLQIYFESDISGIDTTEGLEYIDNEDAHYYFDMNKSTAKRKFESEVNFINKKLLPFIKENTSFQKLNVIGVFSNGEAVYKIA